MSDADNAFFIELQTDFLTESAFMFEQFEESMLCLENAQDPQTNLSQIFRVAHSIKGGAAAVGFPDLAKFAHVVEDLLALLRAQPELVNSEVISLLLKSGDQLKNRIATLQKGEATPWDTSELEVQLKELIRTLPGSEPRAEILPDPSFLEEEKMAVSPEASDEKENAPAAATATSGKTTSQKQTGGSIKVDTSRVDSVLDAVGELVVLKNQIIHDESFRNGANARLVAIVDQLDKTVRELYDKTLSIRMTPLKSLFLKIQRIVRDVSLSLNKPVDLKLIGDETEVERTVFELLGDPLVHLVRNAMDHGIENPQVRAEKGKPATAQVTVSARQTGGTVTIEIIDDGGGINRERVLAKAIEKNLVPAGVDPQSLSDERVFQLIFAPGFSTAEKVSDLSGRGVGLDVVRSNLEKINGKIDIRSKLGVGTTFRLSIPLSTAITDGIVVAIEGAKYILPIYSIREIVSALPKDYIVVSKAGRVAKIRDALIPVVELDASIGQINWKELDHMKYSVSRDQESLRARRQESMLIVLESIHGVMALPVDEVIGQAQVVVKPITSGQYIPEVAGAAILGDGRTVLILDPAALTHKRATKSLEKPA